MSEIIYTSIIRCPFCDFEKEETMPINACWHFYNCKNCEKIVKPRQRTVSYLPIGRQVGQLSAHPFKG